MSERSPDAVKKIIPFGKDPYMPAPKEAFAPGKDPYAPKREVRDARDTREVARDTREVATEADPVERSGQAIVALLQQAAEAANSQRDRAMDVAHKLSMQLRVAEERVRELELDMRHYQDRAQRAEERAQRAEKWLVRIYKDVEEKFFEQKAPPEQAQR
jgi:hypothetical protein